MSNPPQPTSHIIVGGWLEVSAQDECLMLKDLEDEDGHIDVVSEDDWIALCAAVRALRATKELKEWKHEP